MLKANARQRTCRHAATGARGTSSERLDRYLWPEPRNRFPLEHHLVEPEMPAVHGRIGGRQDGCTERGSCRIGTGQSWKQQADIIFARADRDDLWMSLAILAAKVKGADEEGAWKRSIAHVQSYNTVQETINRRAFLCGVNKTFVVSGPASGPIRFDGDQRYGGVYRTTGSIARC